MLPKITADIHEYFRLIGKKERKVPDRVLGYYWKNVIWTRKKNFRTILHELGHWILRKPYEHNLSASLILFCDFITEVYEFINGMLFYPKWRESIHKCLDEVEISFNDWLDWVLCR